MGNEPTVDWTACIYHVCRRQEWSAARATGVYAGSTQDKADGFIHFSALAQLRVSVAKHRAGQDDLILLVVDPDQLGASLVWEPSRGGALFPHLYGVLPVEAVLRADPVMLGADGHHHFPADLPAVEEGI
ncbi:MAG: DUF952 domain-containing protein [Rhodospirillales bacterium]